MSKADVNRIVHQAAKNISQEEKATSWIKVIVDDSGLDTVDDLRQGLNDLVANKSLTNIKFVNALRSLLSETSTVTTSLPTTSTTTTSTPAAPAIKPASVVAAKPTKKTNVVFIGNPGVGKSTLLNGLVGDLKFKSGLSIGTGLTAKLQAHDGPNGVVYMDTPGLADEKKRVEAAKEIELALKSGGDFRVCFVVTSEAGRIRPESMMTIKVVTRAVSTPFNFGIVANKISKRLMGRQKELVQALSDDTQEAAGRPPGAILLCAAIDELNDEDNVLPRGELVQEMAKFIDQLKPHPIATEDVRPLKVDDLDKLRTEMERQQAELVKKFEEERAEYQKKLDAMSAEMKNAIEARERAARETAVASYNLSQSGRCPAIAKSTGQQCKNTINCPWH